MYNNKQYKLQNNKKKQLRTQYIMNYKYKKAVENDVIKNYDVYMYCIKFLINYYFL